MAAVAGAQGNDLLLPMPFSYGKCDRIAGCPMDVRRSPPAAERINMKYFLSGKLFTM
jgi:hypothetical protein